MADVFISYKRRIRPRVEEIAAALETLKLSVWYDAELEPGKSFGAVINREVASAKCVLVCWTPDAFAPEDGSDISWVESEATLGRERKILVPTLFEKTILNAPWNMLHTENLVTWSADAPPTGSWLGVLAAIGKHVDRPGLAEYARAAADGSAPVLTQWAQTFPDDPLVPGVWERITEIEVAAARAKVEADRERRLQTKAASTSPPPRKPPPPPAVELETAVKADPPPDKARQDQPRPSDDREDVVPPVGDGSFDRTSGVRWVLSVTAIVVLLMSLLLASSSLVSFSIAILGGPLLWVVLMAFSLYRGGLATFARAALLVPIALAAAAVMYPVSGVTTVFRLYSGFPAVFPDAAAAGLVALAGSTWIIDGQLGRRSGLLTIFGALLLGLVAGVVAQVRFTGFSGVDLTVALICWIAVCGGIVAGLIWLAAPARRPLGLKALLAAPSPSSRA